MRLIDADALHERIAAACNRRRKMPGGVDDLFADGLEYAEDMLLNAPTIEVERHGKWVNVNGDYSEAMCGECGWRIETAFGVTGSKLVFNAAEKTLHYCSNCGAKMEEMQIMNKTPYETMQELSVLIGEINDKWGAVNRCRGMNPEDVPPEFYREFVSAKLVDAGYCKGREGKWELGKSGLVSFCSICHNFTSLKLAKEWNYCPYCGAKMEVRTC